MASRVGEGQNIYLNINERGEMELMASPLTNKELIAFLPWQSIKELQKEKGHLVNLSGQNESVNIITQSS